ncbi:hypothetical protein B0H13DRAFT_1859000 [Mycena leptocephala]|nr:hypothetical protein B0H13DRAFT_1859000 [Mycena leptocephala]
MPVPTKNVQLARDGNDDMVDLTHPVAYRPVGKSPCKVDAALAGSLVSYLSPFYIVEESGPTVSIFLQKVMPAFSTPRFYWEVDGKYAGLNVPILGGNTATFIAHKGSSPSGPYLSIKRQELHASVPVTTITTGRIITIGNATYQIDSLWGPHEVEGDLSNVCIARMDDSRWDIFEPSEEIKISESTVATVTQGCIGSEKVEFYKDVEDDKVVDTAITFSVIITMPGDYEVSSFTYIISLGMTPRMTLSAASPPPAALVIARLILPKILKRMHNEGRRFHSGAQPINAASTSTFTKQVLDAAIK